MDNYRPISLTSVVAKLMERIVSDQTRLFLDNNQLLSIHQHGFRSGHSTLTQLLECLQDWCLSRNESVDVIYLDLAKAFDSVSHRKLMHKLLAYGIEGDLHRWIRAFLSDRKQCVMVQNSSSFPFSAGRQYSAALWAPSWICHVSSLSTANGPQPSP